MPLPGVEMVLEASGGGSSRVQTAGDGSFSLAVAPGTYSMTLGAGTLSVGAAAPGNFSFGAHSITISGNLHEDLTLPVHMVTVRVLEASGNPVSGVTVSGGGSSAIVEGALGPGIALSEGDVLESATTGADGTAVFSLPDFTGNQTFELHPPANTPLASTTISLAGVNEDQTREVTLPAGVTFSGVLFGEGGVPLPGVEMVLEASGGGSSRVQTAGDGSFSLTVAPGTYSMTLGAGSLSVGAAAPGNFSFGAHSITISGNLHEDLTLPVHMVTVRVLEANGNPVSGVTVSGGGSSAIVEGALGPGIALSEGDVLESATTGADGTAVFSLPDFTGNQTFELHPPANTPLASTTISLAGVNEDQTREVTLPAGVTFSGVLFGEGGVPLPGVEMVLEASGGGSSRVQTAGDGSFSLTVAPGTYSMTLGAGSLSVGAAAPGNFSFGAHSITISGNLHEDLTLPVHMVTVRVLEANGNPVSGVTVSGGGSSAIVEGALGPGIALSEGDVLESATTGADGTAVFSLPDFTGNQTFELHPPANTPLASTTISLAGVNEDQTRVIAYPYYARVTSAGTSAGTVEIASPPETTLSAVSDEQAKEAGLPEGAVAVVGSVSYTVSGLTPGGSVNVTLQLPPGSEPTNVFKLINGSYVDVTSIATISGNTVTLHLTDGGLGDADGTANGVIVDPVVPVHITKHAQTISFSSTAPAKPPIGSKYTVEATASSGLPVSFSIDGSSTAGACSVSAGTVSFTGVGTCIIDANQAGNETYLPAPQQQQTVEVVKASQTITFTTTALSQPNVGSVYAIAASATSGLPVSYSVDKASQKGACKISGTSVSFTGAGSCVIDANQSGDATHLAAPQVQQTMTVTAAKASTTTTMVLTAPSAVYGSEQADVAKVAITAAGGGTIPTGKIAVKTSTKTLCTATISNGTGSCMIGPKVLNPGVYPVVAVYTATTHFGASASSSSTLTVTKDPTSTALSLSAASVTYGSEQTEIVNVTVTAGGGITPTGSVKIKAGTKTVCTATLNAGVGTCSPKATTLPKGNYNVEAVYAGSTTLEPSMSSSTSLTIS